ncbi:MAG: hypothetical protein FWE35_08380 [Streptosporangiales bacterium]|nr:hypothetical protein [Streptosporangiales bacterium]
MATKTEAEAEWAALGRETQRQVKRDARRLRPHPDPAVSRCAARYAQDLTDRTSRKSLLVRALFPVLVYVILNSVLDGLDLRGNAETLSLLGLAVVFIACVIVAVPAMAGLHRLNVSTRVKTANWLALDSAIVQPAPPGEGAPSADALAVRYVPRKFARALALMVSLACAAGGFTGSQIAGEHGLVRSIDVALMVFLAVVFLSMIGTQAWALARWAVPRKPIVDLDARGAHFNVVPVTVPWSAVREIGLFPLRAGLGNGTVGIVGFVCDDPDAALAGARLNWLRRRMMNRSARVFGTPFTLTGAMIDHTTEEVAAVASRFAGIPVRRH